MKHLHEEDTFAATPDELFELLTDARIQTRRALHQGALDADTRIDTNAQDETLVVTVEHYGRPGDPDPIERTHVVAWDASHRHAEWQEFGDRGHTTPIAHGTLDIGRDDDDSAILILDGQVDSQIPVVAPLVDHRIAEELHQQHGREVQYYRQHLLQR